LSPNSQKSIPRQVEPFEPSKAARPCLSLVDLTPKTYIDTIVRVVSIRAKEKQDNLGKRPYIVGIVEDSTFKALFISYKPNTCFFRDSVFKFQNVYVHEFQNHSIMVVLGEHSRITLLSEENPEDYIWQPKIGRIRRPLGSCWVTLQGIVSSVYPSSGLVKRCEKCNRVIFDSSCPEGHKNGWRWSVRISGRLSDETGSINTIFSQYLTCKLLGRPISEVLYMANVPEGTEFGDFNIESFQLEIPETLVIHEATVMEPGIFRQCKKLIVPDFHSSKIYCPTNLQVTSNQILQVDERTLEYRSENDRFLYRRLLEKTLDLQIRKCTELPKLHGIFLVEKPVSLYWTEQAKLYLGLELNVSEDPSGLSVEFYPKALIRESVLDYVQWRRSRGASVKGVENKLLKWRRNVILAPNGTYGRIVKILYEDAGGFEVPGFNLSLPEFWRVTHDIKVEDDERPLLVVKPYNLDVEFTYPPSCVFFDEQSIYIRGSILAFVNCKKFSLVKKASNIAKTVLNDLRIGEQKIKISGGTKNKIDPQRMLLQDIKEKLLGRTVKAKGSVVQPSNRLYFFPKTVSGVS